MWKKSLKTTQSYGGGKCFGFFPAAAAVALCTVTIS
jgi:hypothetical protein